TNARQRLVIIPNHVHALLQAVPEYFQCIVQVFAKIDFLQSGLIHIGIALHSRDEFADSLRTIVDFTNQPKHRHDRGDTLKRISQKLRTDLSAEPLELRVIDTALGENGSNFPAVGYVVSLQPRVYSFLSIAQLQGITW